MLTGPRVRACKNRALHCMLAFLTFGVAGACRSLREQQEADASQLREIAQQRLGVEIPEFEPLSAEVTAEIAALLRQDLSEDGAVKVALLNNPQVRGTFAELGVASAELVRAGLLANPVFAMQVERFGGGTELELRLAQPFFEIFFRSARLKLAAGEHAAARARIAQQLIAIVFQVRRAIVEVRAADALVAARDLSKAAASEAFELASALQQAGNFTDPDLTVLELALQEAQLAYLSATIVRADAMEWLAALLGVDSGQYELRVAGTLAPNAAANLDGNALEARVLSASLELEQKRALIKAQAERSDLATKQAYLAASQLGISARREFDGQGWGSGPALSLPLPLWDRGASSRSAAEARLAALLAEQWSLELELRSQTKRLYARLLGHQEEIDLMTERHLPLANRLVSEVLQNYNAMQVGAFDVLRVKREELELQARYIEYLRQAWQARVDLEELLAGSWGQRALNDVRSDTRGATDIPIAMEH